MKKILMFLVIFAGFLVLSPANELDDTLRVYYSQNQVKGDATQVDDHSWIRRLYIDLAGRIPTTKEINSFVKSEEVDKKSKVVDKLLDSEDYVNNYYAFWGDLFRIRTDRLSDSTGQLESYPYMDYVRNFIREDMSYKGFVYSLLTATGRYTDNPATGYYLRDTGMLLDNLVTTSQVFIGKDIACAQCHDDPFQDYTQMQFYEMAAFFNTINTRDRIPEYRDVLKKVDSEIMDITGQDRIDNRVRQLLSANLFALSDDDNKQLKLPHDYQYDDAKPNDVVIPVSLDGKMRNVKNDKRDEAANWIVNNPDFSMAIANRLWESVVGKSLVSDPVNFSIDESSEAEVILSFLGKYLVENNYSIKQYLRLLFTSDFYSRLCYSGDEFNYQFQAVLLKRMSSYQIWDSLMTLTIPDVNYTRISFADYSDIVEIDWGSVSGKELLATVDKVREYERGLSKKFLKYKNVDLVRGCFVLNRNSFAGQFLAEYGSSDRRLIDTTDDNGSITQILIMMNSPIVDVISSSQSILQQAKTKQDIFLAILGRLPTMEELSLVKNVDRVNLIWSLINSREFIFRA